MSVGPRTRTRYVLTGTLAARTGIHLGAGSGVPGVDLVVQTDGLGRPVITGTSLAGVLKSVVRRGLESAFVGDATTRARATALLGSTTRASNLVVDDAPMTTGGLRQIRDGVGIARRSGVADPGVLYSREVLVPGSRFDFRLAVLDPEHPPEEEEVPPGAGRWLALTCARALAAGIRVGGGTTRGLGLLVLDDAELTATGDLATPSGVLDALSGASEQVEIGDVGAPPGVLRVRVGWEPRGTLMCSIAVDGAVDAMPQTTPVITATGKGASEVRLLLPGSGIKGALRARAEVITRTVLSVDPADPHRSATSVLDACGDETLPDVRSLFGAPARSDKDPRSRRLRQDGRRGALHVDDVLSSSAVEAGRWAKVEKALVSLPAAGKPDDGEKERKAAQRLEFRNAVESLNQEVRDAGLKFAVIDHVAVDRWTGGAASNRLFAAAEPTSCAWEPITLELDLTPPRLAAGEAKGAVALLLLTLRDLADGWVPLGKGTRRGWGDVAVTSILVEVDEGSEWEWLAGDLLRPTEEQLTALDSLIGDWFERVEAAGRAREAKGAAS